MINLRPAYVPPIGSTGPLTRVGSDVRVGVGELSMGQKFVIEAGIGAVAGAAVAFVFIPTRIALGAGIGAVVGILVL